jgi:hypothetical protein
MGLWGRMRAARAASMKKKVEAAKKGGEGK